MQIIFFSCYQDHGLLELYGKLWDHLVNSAMCVCVLSHFRTSLVAQMVKHLPTIWETLVRYLGQEDPLEKEMAIHSSTLAWEIPWTENPGRLQSMELQRVGHDWVTSLHFTLSHFSQVRFFVTPWTVVFQVPLSMGFSRRVYWRGLSCPPPGDLPDPGTGFGGTELASLRLRWRVLYYQRHLWRPASQLSYICWESEFSKLLGGSDGKESACNVKDLDLIPGSRRSPGEGKGYPLQYSGLENSMHRGSWSMGSPESDMTKWLST